MDDLTTLSDADLFERYRTATEAGLAAHRQWIDSGTTEPPHEWHRIWRQQLIPIGEEMERRWPAATEPLS